MRSIDNMKLFDFSLDHPEPIIDEHYVKAGDLIISADFGNPTDLMRTNVDLIEAISAYSFALKNQNKSSADRAIATILDIIKCKNINYSEFVSFWPVVDVSYSLFSKMNVADQKGVLKKIVEKYIQLRHNLYSSYGYTPTTLQVGKDAKAHKESGSLGTTKVSEILHDAGFETGNTSTVKYFISHGDKKYIEADKKGKNFFNFF